MELAQEIWNEDAVMTLLGISRQQLDYLRLEKNFPVVYLGQRVRIYLAGDILAYIQKRAKETTN